MKKRIIEMSLVKIKLETLKLSLDKGAESIKSLSAFFKLLKKRKPFLGKLIRVKK